MPRATIIHAVDREGRGLAAQRIERPNSKARMYQVRVEGGRHAMTLSRAVLKLAIRSGARVLGRLRTWEGF